MRNSWTRSDDEIKLTDAQLTELIEPVLPNSRILQSQTTEGGLANCNIVFSISDSKELYLLRLFTRDSSQAQKEINIHHLIKETVPTGEYLFFSTSNKFTNHPYAIRKWIGGTRLEKVMLELDEAEITEA